MTAPARAVAWASGDRRASRARTASSMVSGTRGFADRGAVHACLGAERAEQLLDMERDPVGPLVHRGGDVARGRQPGPEEERRHEGRLPASSGTSRSSSAIRWVI